MNKNIYYCDKCFCEINDQNTDHRDWCPNNPQIKNIEDFFGAAFKEKIKK